MNDLALMNVLHGADSAKVIRVVGIPDSVRDVALSKKFPYSGISAWYYMDCTLYMQGGKKLEGIKLFHARFTTARGLAIGDSLNRVRELYGASNRDFDLPYSDLTYTCAENPALGISIHVEKGIVSSIYVGRFY